MAKDERRRYPRFNAGISFVGQGPDGPVMGQAVNQGSGGAFLETAGSVRTGSKLVLTVHDPFERDKPVFLVARVAYSRDEPKQGVGIQWQAAISRFGMARLKQFLETHFLLVIDPRKSGAFSGSSLEGAVAYEFSHGVLGPASDELLEEIEDAETYYGIKFSGGFLPKAQYLEVRLVPPDAGAKTSQFRRELSMDRMATDAVDKYGPGEVVTQPIAVDKEADPSLSEEDLQQWKYEMKRRKRLSLPVSMTIRGEEVEGQLKNFDRDNLFLLVAAVKPATGDRVILEMPLSVSTRSAQVVVVGDVTRIARDKRTKHVGIDVRILSLDERGEDGIFEQLLLAL